MHRAITIGLIADYSIACAWSAFSPEIGLWFLFGISLLPMLYFLVLAVIQSFLAILISAAIEGFAVALLSTVVFAWLAPIIALIPIIWAAFSLANKLRRFAQKLPYGLGSMALYGFLALSFVIKSIAFVSQIEISNPYLIYVEAILMAALGVGLMTGLVNIYHAYHRRRSMAAVYMIGFGWYLFFFILKLLIPGDDGLDQEDDSVDDDDSHHHH